MVGMRRLNNDGAVRSVLDQGAGNFLVKECCNILHGDSLSVQNSSISGELPRLGAVTGVNSLQPRMNKQPFYALGLNL